MKGAFYQQIRQVRVSPTDTPAPPSGHVRIQVSHVGICGTDLHIFLGDLDHRAKPPQVIGHESAGQIDSVGPDVEGWRPGDRVTAMPLISCGQCAACRLGVLNVCYKLNVLGVDSTGAMQSYWNVPAHLLHRIPDSLAFEHAALIEPVAVACHALRVAQPAAGEFGVVLGGGPIGALVAMVAKAWGLSILVAEVNPFRIGLLHGAGLEVVDPRATDLVAFVNERSGGAGADIVFECAGHARTAAMMTELVRAHGLIEIVSLFAEPAPVNLHRFFARELRLCGTRVYTHEDFDEAIRLLAARAQPFEKLITTVLPLEGLQEGLEAMEQGRDVMKVLIDCQA